MIRYSPEAERSAEKRASRDTLHVWPSTEPLAGAIAASPSKSYTHRAILLSLLCPSVEVRNPLLAGDTLSSLAAAGTLGARVVERDDSRGLLRLARADPAAVPRQVDCGNSGTTMRIATPLAATLPGLTRLTGDATLLQRPMGPLVEALAALGAPLARCLGASGRPPVEVEGPIRPGSVKLPGDVSSQFVTGLLFAGARLGGGLTVDLTSPLKSAPYVSITVSLLRHAGIEASLDPHSARVPPGAEGQPSRVEVPGDWSSAAFPLAAAAVTRGEVRIEGLPDDPHQGDRAIGDLLRRMGARVEERPSEVALSASGPLAGVAVDLSDTPDMVPIVAVLGACARGETRITGAAHARLKESDRLGLTARNLRSMGARVEETTDGLVVRGGPLHGAAIETQGDHRQVMAFAVAALVAKGETTIADGAAFSVSYPRFAEDLAGLGANLLLEEAAP